MTKPISNVPATLLPGSPEDVILENEIMIFDETNPRSVLNLVPEKIKVAIQNAYFEHMELFEKDEQDLYKYLRTNNKTPSATDNRVRLKFWVEYDRAQGSHQPMSVRSVIANIMSRELFDKRYVENPYKVAWMLCPPIDYMTKATEALSFGLDQLRDMLSIPHTSGANERFDARLADIKVKIVKMLDDRVQGGVIQRVESKNLDVRVTSRDRKLIDSFAQALSEEELDKRLADLDRRERQALHLPPERTEMRGPADEPPDRIHDVGDIHDV